MKAFVRTMLLSILVGFNLACGSAGGSDLEDLARIREMYEDYRKDFPSVSGATAEELRERISDATVALVDVRTPEEQRVSMIPGAVTAEEFEADRERYRDVLVVAYCTIGARSGRYAGDLEREGFNVRNLEGGILSWTHAGGELTGPEGSTRKVHVYGRRWNLAADGYDAVW